MKIFNSVFCVAVLVFSTAVLAESDWEPGTRAETEIDELSIKLSQDGTGIIKDVTCGTCDFNFVKITANTQAFANSVKVDISRAASRAGKQVYIVFHAKTAEVRAIYWAE